MKFTKPALSIANQIALLESRGMNVPDKAKAAHYLFHISYYRLRAYWLPLEQGTPDHVFKAGTSFDDALELYVFDRQLRLLVMDAIERIEISLRGSWAHYLAMSYGPHGYAEAKYYANSVHHAFGLSTLMSEVAKSRDTFIMHYNTKYGDPTEPPVWMVAEILTLGALSKWFGNLKLRADRQAISKPYGLDELILVSAAHHLAHVRNICAHHARLWNRRFTVTMTIPTAPADLGKSMSAGSARQLYNTLALLSYLMQIVAPGSKWKVELVEHLKSSKLADPSAMGFPNQWEQLPIWK